MSIFLKIKIEHHGDEDISIEDIKNHMRDSFEGFIDGWLDIDEITEEVQNPLRFFDVRFASTYDCYERFIVQATNGAMAIKMASEFASRDYILDSVTPIRSGLHPKTELDTRGGVVLSGHGDGYYLTMYNNPREKVERELAHERARTMLRQRIERELANKDNKECDKDTP